MVKNIPNRRGSPGRRLESWLVRTIQGGDLKGLPLYFPLGSRVGQHPEQYARALLSGLKEESGHSYALERLRDDGRAFRSWAESTPVEADRSDRFWPAC